MKMFAIGILSLAILPSAFAAASPALEGIVNVGTRLAPSQLSLDAYSRWIEPIAKPDGKDFTSAFAPSIFSWYEQQKDAPLPPQVSQDPDKIFVDVETAKAQAIALEKSRDIETYVAAGADVYAIRLEDLRSDPAGTMSRCAAWLGIDAAAPTLRKLTYYGFEWFGDIYTSPSSTVKSGARRAVTRCCSHEAGTRSIGYGLRRGEPLSGEPPTPAITSAWSASRPS
mgnify:CR=1 FL=1